MTISELLIVEPLDGYSQGVGAALWRLQDTRRRTLALLKELPAGFIDRQAHGNTIGTILYHVALVEADWLYMEILEEPIPPDLLERFPVDTRDAAGLLTYVRDQGFDQHLERLSAVRSHLLSRLQGMSEEDFRRPRHLPQYDVSPEWVLHHLAQHEGEHRGELGAVVTFLKAGG